VDVDRKEFLTQASLGVLAFTIHALAVRTAGHLLETWSSLT